MQTHSIQFGRHKSHSHTPSHASKVGGQIVASHPKSSGNDDHDQLVKQTQKWVAQTFYGELLKQMRNSPFKNKTMDGGEGGAAFTQMFDQQMADKMSRGTGRKLVDSIVSKIEAHKAYGAAGAQTKHIKIKSAALSPTLQAKMGGLK